MLHNGASLKVSDRSPGHRRFSFQISNLTVSVKITLTGLPFRIVGS